MGSGASSKKATASPRVAVAKHALPGEVGFGPKATDIDAAGVSEGKSLRGGGCRNARRSDADRAFARKVQQVAKHRQSVCRIRFCSIAEETSESTSDESVTLVTVRTGFKNAEIDTEGSTASIPAGDSLLSAGSSSSSAFENKSPSRGSTFASGSFSSGTKPMCAEAAPLEAEIANVQPSENPTEISDQGSDGSSGDSSLASAKKALRPVWPSTNSSDSPSSRIASVVKERSIDSAGSALSDTGPAAVAGAGCEHGDLCSTGLSGCSPFVSKASSSQGSSQSRYWRRKISQVTAAPPRQQVVERPISPAKCSGDFATVSPCVGFVAPGQCSSGSSSEINEEEDNTSFASVDAVLSEFIIGVINLNNLDTGSWDNDASSKATTSLKSCDKTVQPIRRAGSGSSYPPSRSSGSSSEKATGGDDSITSAELVPQRPSSEPKHRALPASTQDHRRRSRQRALGAQ
eukprot:TRINITY_DN2349_c0_g4_i1.p1 TRINITY_DN2349_c0_g4~~TRINITY_DN2349_c0_g4_i1.p1  ORF type:complete len:461 (-),score=61.23 TRINITY_DN2349_c0_g4_i1:53-1435(-)